MPIRRRSRSRYEQQKNPTFGDPGGKLSVAAVYPGPQAEGLASLAVHGIYRLVNSFRFAICERIFWNGKSRGEPRSLESGRVAGTFDLLAFSVSFEEQWVLLPSLLRAAGIPPRWVDRHETHPVVVVGGFACRLNPHPALPFVDLVVPGEAEVTLPAILTGLEEGRGKRREEVLAQLATVAGVAVRPGRGDRIGACFDRSGKPVAQALIEPGSYFANMFLVETGRGCPVGCRFCATGFSRRPPVFFQVGEILEAARAGVALGLKIGLVGASLARHPELVQLMEHLAEVGVDFSPASLEVGALVNSNAAFLVGQIARCGQRTVTLAPETGSARLRKMINKPLDEMELETAVRRIAEAGIPNLKLYLLYGLPTEEEEDLQASIDLVGKVRGFQLDSRKQREKASRLAVSLNPFVPKPHTPFAVEAMPQLAELRRRRARLVEGMRKVGGISVSGFSPRLAVLQCLLDRGDESLADLLEQSEGSWPPPTGLVVERVPELQDLVHRPWPAGKEARWMVDVGVDPEALYQERERAEQGILTPSCKRDRCVVCGVCTGLT